MEIIWCQASNATTTPLLSPSFTPTSSWNEGLCFLNCRSISTQLPDEVKGIYSEEKYQEYQKSQEYKKTTCRFELVTASLQVVILLALLMGGGFVFIDGLVWGRVQC